MFGNFFLIKFGSFNPVLDNLLAKISKPLSLNTKKNPIFEFSKTSFKFVFQQIPLLTMVPFLRSFVSIYYYLQTHIALPRDQLYLYSKADTMIKAKYVQFITLIDQFMRFFRHVEKFIEKQKEKGNSVTAIDFVDSEHVAHIRTHPKDYRTACLNFVRHVEASYK